MTDSCNCQSEAYSEAGAASALVEDPVGTAAAGGGEPPLAWEGVIGIEGEMTGDGRFIKPEALYWSDLPLPLRYVPADNGAHLGAVVVGKIVEIAREGSGEIVAKGTFDSGSSAGREAARLVREDLVTGVSMDLDDVSFEVRAPAAPVAGPSGQELAPLKPGKDGRVVIRDNAADAEVMVTKKARVRAATMVPVPAFSRTKIVMAPETVVAAGEPGPGLLADSYNWVEDVGGLPEYIRRIADHIMATGKSEGHSIAVAVNVVKKMCATGDLNFPGEQDVNPKSRAEACAAVAQWEAKKARAKADAAESQAFREVSQAERERLAEQNKAMPGGSFPIANCSDLANAIRAIGRANDPAAVRAHIKRRAEALNCEDVTIPEGWAAARWKAEKRAKASAPAATEVCYTGSTGGTARGVSDGGAVRNSGLTAAGYRDNWKKQWRNPRNGRWIDMPWTALDRVFDEFPDFADSDDGQAISNHLDLAGGHIERGDGPRAKREVKKAKQMLDNARKDVRAEAAAPGGEERGYVELADELAVLGANIDTFLNHYIPAEQSDIGAGDEADIGAKDAQAGTYIPRAPQKLPGMTFPDGRTVHWDSRQGAFYGPETTDAEKAELIRAVAADPANARNAAYYNKIADEYENGVGGANQIAGFEGSLSYRYHRKPGLAKKAVAMEEAVAAQDYPAISQAARDILDDPEFSDDTWMGKALTRIAEGNPAEQSSDIGAGDEGNIGASSPEETGWLRSVQARDDLFIRQIHAPGSLGINLHMKRLDDGRFLVQTNSPDRLDLKPLEGGDDGHFDNLQDVNAAVGALAERVRSGPLPEEPGVKKVLPADIEQYGPGTRFVLPATGKEMTMAGVPDMSDPDIVGVPVEGVAGGYVWLDRMTPVEIIEGASESKKVLPAEALRITDRMDDSALASEVNDIFRRNDITTRQGAEQAMREFENIPETQEQHDSGDFALVEEIATLLDSAQSAPVASGEDTETVTMRIDDWFSEIDDYDGMPPEGYKAWERLSRAGAPPAATVEFLMRNLNPETTNYIRSLDDEAFEGAIVNLHPRMQAEARHMRDPRNDVVDGVPRNGDGSYGDYDELGWVVRPSGVNKDTGELEWYSDSKRGKRISGPLEKLIAQRKSEGASGLTEDTGAGDTGAAPEPEWAPLVYELEEIAEEMVNDTMINPSVSGTLGSLITQHMEQPDVLGSEIRNYLERYKSRLPSNLVQALDEIAEELHRNDMPGGREYGGRTLRAAAPPHDPDAPPAAFFSNPNLKGPTALTITDDGRVYGHLATWQTCHLSYQPQGKCVPPPRSSKRYAHFHTGSLRTREGSEIAVGRITLDTGHAEESLSAASALAHYDHTGAAVADVVAGEDSHGIWFSGSLRPGLSPRQVRAFRAAPLSGDWRRFGTALELVAALAVNVPGFTVLRTQGLVASGAMKTLVSAGALRTRPERRTSPQLSDEDIRYLKKLAARERAEAEMARMAVLDQAAQTARRLRAQSMAAVVHGTVEQAAGRSAVEG